MSLRITELLCKAKLDDIDLIAILTDAHRTIVRLDVTTHKIMGINVLEKFCSILFILYLHMVPKFLNYIDQHMCYITPHCKLYCTFFGKCYRLSSISYPSMPYLLFHTFPSLPLDPHLPFLTFQSISSFLTFHSILFVLFVLCFPFHAFCSTLSIPYLLFCVMQSVFVIHLIFWAHPLPWSNATPTHSMGPPTIHCLRPLKPSHGPTTIHCLNYPRYSIGPSTTNGLMHL